MVTKLSTLSKNTGCSAILNSIDVGALTQYGYIEIRNGTRPLTPQNAATGVVLAAINFSRPAFQSPVDGVSVANTLEEVNISETGIASWFRVYNRNREVILDGDVTKNGEGGDITFDDINFIKDGKVLIGNLFAVKDDCGNF